MESHSYIWEFPISPGMLSNWWPIIEGPRKDQYFVTDISKKILEMYKEVSDTQHYPGTHSWGRGALERPGFKTLETPLLLV